MRYPPAVDLTGSSGKMSIRSRLSSWNIGENSYCILYADKVDYRILSDGERPDDDRSDKPARMLSHGSLLCWLCERAAVMTDAQER